MQSKTEAGGFSLGSRSAVAELGLGTASRFCVLAKHRSGVRILTFRKQLRNSASFHKQKICIPKDMQIFCYGGGRILPRLSFCHRRTRSRHRLAVLRARKTSLRRSHPHVSQAVAKLRPLNFTPFNFGGGRIRTSEPLLAVTSLAVRCFRPLSHASNFTILFEAWLRVSPLPPSVALGDLWRTGSHASINYVFF